MYGVRELRETDIPLIRSYWLDNEPSYLKSMGVDLKKLPDGKALEAMLEKQMQTPFEAKSSYALIWEMHLPTGDAVPIGHCNVNGIEYGELAYMHLHLWQGDHRKKGIGTELLWKSLPLFFKNLNLKRLYCQPYALNPAPNATLKKLGFRFERRHRTVPGSLNFEQEVNIWYFDREWLVDSQKS